MQGEIISIPSGEDFDGLDGHVLRFTGAFSEVQFLIETIVGMHLRRQMPHLGSALVKHTMSRLTDDQRNKLFRALAREVQYSGDLTNFGVIFERAKQLRNKVGHALSIGPVVAPGRQLVVGVTHTLTSKTDAVPEPLLPSTFIRMTADCKWLTQHVLRVGYVAQPDAFKDAAGNPSEPPDPGSLPVGGESLRRPT